MYGLRPLIATGSVKKKERVEARVDGCPMVSVFGLALRGQETPKTSQNRQPPLNKSKQS